MPSGNKKKRGKTAPKKTSTKKSANKKSAAKKSTVKKSAVKKSTGGESDLNTTLNQISDESVAEAKKEFQELLAKAKGDTAGFIQENAQELEERLLEVRDKKLDREDFNYFVERQKRSLQIFIDSQPAQAQERAEKLTISLLEMAAKKIVPILIAMI